MSLPIIALLQKPSVILNWGEQEWESLIEQAYYTGLVAKIYYILHDNSLLNSVPAHIRWHFTSADKLFLAHQQDVHREVEQINGILKSTGIKPTYLKGTAYLLDKLACSKGRIFADVDVFVDKTELTQAENILKWQGWTVKELDEHDQHYYRRWMHELPPMVNSKSGITLDLHHNLIPVVSRVRLDGSVILDGAVEKEQAYRTLSSEDKVLHSAAHLLLDSEFNHGFRDLHDIYLMLMEFQSEDECFIDRLQKRAIELNFDFILYHCLRLQQEMFLLPIDNKILSGLRTNRIAKLKAEIIVKLFKVVLLPTPDKKLTFAIYSYLLFLRSHWLKMPLNILIPHLTYKAFIKPFKQDKAEKVS